MDYDLYLKYDADVDLNINNDIRKTSDEIFATILHETDEALENAGNDEPERTKIGFIHLFRYNQILAKTYGVNMTHNRLATMRVGSKALMELDYSLITQETIDEVGTVSNPNIVVVAHFGISAAWRNKGIGEQVLKGIMKQMIGKYGYMLIMEPKPAQIEEHEVCKRLYNVQGVEFAELEKDPEKAQWKLNAFWQRCGLKQFKDYDNIFICNVEQTVPKLLRAKASAISFSKKSNV